MKKVQVNNPQAVVKRAAYLAYKASKVIGMGVFAAKDNVTEDEVWGIVHMDGNNHISGDYIFGRMIKIRLDYGDDHIKIAVTPHPGYQSWCTTYPTYEALVDAAVASLTEAVVTESTK